MIALWIWVSMAVVFSGGFCWTRFRPLLSVAVAAGLAALLAGTQAQLIIQFAVFLGGAVLFELIFRPVQNFFRREKTDPAIEGVIGKTGKLRDIVNLRRNIFLLHLEGRDWLAIPSPGGKLALGDTVEAAGAQGKKVVVRTITTR